MLLVPDYTELRQIVRDASSIVVVTGAGISASAGIPTYRDRDSGWTDGEMEKIMHASRYGSHLAKVWGFWGQLRATALSAGPTAAHRALAADPRVKVLTQNVDGLHILAGSPTIELHGSVLRTRCIRCNRVWADTSIHEPGVVPSCENCIERHAAKMERLGQDKPYLPRTRTDVVLFGEELVSRDVKLAFEQLRKADVCLYVGTSGNVWPVATFMREARKHGAVTALLNRDPWKDGHTDFDVVKFGDSDELVPELLGS